MTRHTPEDDVNRLAERLYNRSGKKMATSHDFDVMYDAYMTQQGAKLNKEQDTTLRNKVFDRLQKHHKLTRSAGGTNKERDKLLEKAAITPSKSEFSDKGYEGGKLIEINTVVTKDGKQYGYVGGRITSLRRTTVVDKQGNTRVVWVDMKGREGVPRHKE